MQITLDSYINNPTGGRAHMIGERQAAAASYGDKFDKTLLQSSGMIDYHMFRKPEDRYIIVIKIPSEKIPKLFYDVAVEFYTKDDATKKMTSLDNYFVRFFSNDPNFNYTYAYTFKKNNLVIPELVSKLSNDSNKPPRVTNPNKLVGYVKSIYFAYLFITMRGLMSKFNWYGAPPINGSKLQNLVMSTDSKLAQVDKMNKIYQATKNGSMSITMGDPNDPHNLDVKVNKIKTMKQAKKIQTSIYKGNIKRSKTTQQIGYVKRIGR